jgi:hypothetical protein
VRRNAALTPGTLELIIGSSFHGLTAQPAPRASSPAAAPAGTPSAGLQPSAPSRSPVGDLTKSYGGITANANVCRDTAAFAGPDGRS